MLVELVAVHLCHRNQRTGGTAIEIASPGIDYNPATTTLQVTTPGSGAELSIVVESFTFDRYRQILNMPTTTSIRTTHSSLMMRAMLLINMILHTPANLLPN